MRTVYTVSEIIVTLCYPRWTSGRNVPGLTRRSPAAFPPLAEMRALGSQRGVLAVPRVHPGTVGKRAEQPLGHVGEQRVEVLGRVRLAHAAREQRVSREHVRRTGQTAARVVDDGD